MIGYYILAHCFNMSNISIAYCFCFRMGLTYSNLSASYNTYTKPVGYMPDISKPPIFDPLLGFPEGRKEREPPPVSEEVSIR